MNAKYVWYVSYGSNMCRQRLGCYLEGGQPEGASRTYPGARDRTPPRADAAVELPGRVYFGGYSPTWGGGIAFYDHAQPGPSLARAYLITAGQFADIAAQEMRREPGPDSVVERTLIDGLPAGRFEAGPGRYETLIALGQRDGASMYTFTSPGGIDDVPHADPTQPYLAMLCQGLQESLQWSQQRALEHFTALFR